METPPAIVNRTPGSASHLAKAVVALRQVSARLGAFADAGNPVRTKDLAKFAHEVELLERETEGRPPRGDEAPADREWVRAFRHDGRNRLNHLFGLAQLLRLGEVPGPMGAALDDTLAALERCLSEFSAVGEVEADSQVARSSAFPGPEVAATATGSLLIADDDAENREILRRLLEPRGFELDFAENGLEAIARMGARDYDAVLLDIQMPEMDGFEVLSRLRESGQLGNTPVIVVTGLQEEQDAVRCIENGAEDFLSRPIRPALLMARLNASLEKKRLREKVFEQHFTRELARELARNPDPMKMQAREAEVSVLFCDIRGFSAVSERLDPTQTVAWLGGVMGEFSSMVIEHGGVLVDYTGDELLAMWGAPNEQPDHAELACRAALGILRSLPGLNEKWRPVIEAETEVGIGINSGVALVGNIGTHRKFKYGPLGNAVNLASRVQGATKFLKTSLLLTGETAARLRGAFPTRRLCRARVLNIKAPVDLHELEVPGVYGDWERLSRRYEEALGAFEGGDFAAAETVLAAFLEAVPGDGPALLLGERIARAREAEGTFDRVWTLPGK